MDLPEQKRIEENRKLYEKLSKDKDYTDVEFTVFLNTFLFWQVHSICIAFVYELTCCAHFIVGYERKFKFPFSDVAVQAPLDSVGVVVGKCLLLYARIEMEDALGVLTRRLLTECHCLVVWCHGVL